MLPSLLLPFLDLWILRRPEDCNCGLTMGPGSTVSGGPQLQYGAALSPRNLGLGNLTLRVFAPRRHRTEACPPHSASCPAPCVGTPSWSGKYQNHVRLVSPEPAASRSPQGEHCMSSPFLAVDIAKRLNPGAIPLVPPIVLCGAEFRNPRPLAPGPPPAVDILKGRVLRTRITANPRLVRTASRKAARE